MRSRLRSKLGSKSFNDLDDSGHYSTASTKRSGASARSHPHHRTLRSSFSSFGGLLGSMGGSSGVGAQVGWCFGRISS